MKYSSSSDNSSSGGGSSSSSSSSAAVQWRDYLAGRVTACCSNGRITAAGCSDGSVYLYDRQGCKLRACAAATTPITALLVLHLCSHCIASALHSYS